jgi:hypothetical protein
MLGEQLYEWELAQIKKALEPAKSEPEVLPQGALPDLGEDIPFA